MVVAGSRLVFAVSGTQFVGCHSVMGGGAIWLRASALAVVSASLSSVSCAHGWTGSDGACVWVNGLTDASVSLGLHGSVFSNLTAQGWAAVISERTDVTVSGCAFSGCRGELGGGLVAVGQASIADATFTNCSARLYGKQAQAGSKWLPHECDSRYCPAPVSPVCPPAYLFLGPNRVCRLAGLPTVRV